MSRLWLAWKVGKIRAVPLLKETVFQVLPVGKRRGSEGWAGSLDVGHLHAGTLQAGDVLWGRSLTVSIAP